MIRHDGKLRREGRNGTRLVLCGAELELSASNPGRFYVEITADEVTLMEYLPEHDGVGSFLIERSLEAWTRSQR